jgi:hypothetical protein
VSLAAIVGQARGETQHGAGLLAGVFLCYLSATGESPTSEEGWPVSGGMVHNLLRSVAVAIAGTVPRVLSQPSCAGVNYPNTVCGYVACRRTVSASAVGYPWQ